MAIAAEFKRASPSKGDIAVTLNAGEQGSLYASVGAAVLSVLTEPKWFKGSLEDMKEVRLATQGMREGRAKLRWVGGGGVTMVYGLSPQDHRRSHLSGMVRGRGWGERGGVIYFFHVCFLGLGG